MVNRGAGYGSEISFCFVFQGHANEVEWIKEEDWRSREESSGSFQKMHEKYYLELFFIVIVTVLLATYIIRIFLI